MPDSLDRLIQLAQISGGINTQCHFQGNWFVQHQFKAQQAVVHIVVEGEGYLKIHGEQNSRRLKKGDIVFFSRSAAHILSNQRSCGNITDTPQTDIQHNIQLKYIGQGQADLKLFCAHFSYDKRADLFQNLPEWLCLNLPDNILQPILLLLEQEVDNHNFGTQRVIDSLSNVLLIAIIRAYLAQKPNDVEGILKGIQDHRLSSLLNAILTSPEQDWSVDNMVEYSHISRAQLMRIFKQKIGLSPHAFVHKIRLQQAAKLLQTSANSVLNIALSSGFQSEPHFIKAFKKMYDMTPSTYRKHNKQ
ncbi:MAG: AraC family transcriptional regulator [Lonepinella koalarum]|nr:AraC family transcriptional regulator [Lonepinella koalarum]